MNKDQFLQALRGKLWGLSAEDVAERIAFYSEAIDDRMEDGSTEEEAVAQLGTVDEIAGGILKERPYTAQGRKEKWQQPYEHRAAGGGLSHLVCVADRCRCRYLVFGGVFLVGWRGAGCQRSYTRRRDSVVLRHG